MKRLFGTDGVRGVANELLKPDLVAKLGMAIAFRLSQPGHPLRVLIGRDTRRSGGMLEGALVGGLCAMGAEVTSAGVLPTPAVAYLTREGHYDLGIMLSASHNPAPDNGIKLISGDGYKLPDALEAEIEVVFFERGFDYDYPAPHQIGLWKTDEREAGHYTLFLLQLMRDAMEDREPLKGMNLVVDCANGAAFKIAPDLLQELGAKLTLVGIAPDGDNINEGCGSTHLNLLRQTVQDEHAHAGVAFDGDADRALLCDEKGAVVDGDRLMTMWAIDRKAQNRMDPPLVVATEMSNFGMEKRLQEENLRLIRTDVGDRYVAERMRETGALIGGEQSGHLIYSERGTTGDGLITMLETLQVVLRSGKPFSEIAHPFEPVPQKLVSVRVQNKQGWREHPHIQQHMQSINAKLQGKGRLSVRASGTENVIRVMVEAIEHGLLEESVATMVRAVEEALT